ncbi:MAG: pitrilysin family protein [Patescibacteria group bacterium]|nr:pitrilysin family protein [Patescibacteria group bacterium]
MFKHQKILLSNKIPLILALMSGVKTATALVMVKTGSKYEKKEESGLSHFLEHMFFKGTLKRPDTLSLSAELDALGGEYNAFTSKEYTGYYVKTAAGKLDCALEILGDMLNNSKFDAIEIEREKGVIIEELNMYEDNPMMHVEDVLESCLYGDTPAGWDTIGTKKNIRAFKRADFLRYFRRQYGANSIAVILSGSIRPADKAAALKIFGNFPLNAWRNKIAVKEKQERPSLKIVNKKTDQINLALALRTVPVGHVQELALKLLSVILGGSMSSRLFISLRERSGLAYYVKTTAEFYTDSGYLSTQAGVPKGKAEEAVKIILSEYRKIASEDVPAAELARAKDIISGRLLMQLEASDEVASWYGRQVVLRERLSNPDELEKKLRSLSASDIRKAAMMVMKNKGLNLAIIGQISSLEKKSIKAALKL